MRYAITKLNVLYNLVLFIFPLIAPIEPAIHSNDENKQSKFKYLAELMSRIILFLFFPQDTSLKKVLAGFVYIIVYDEKLNA